jgi:hypothetical protein
MEKEKEEKVTLEQGLEANLQEFRKLPAQEQQRQNQEAVARARAYLRVHPVKPR